MLKYPESNSAENARVCVSAEVRRESSCLGVGHDSFGSLFLLLFLVYVYGCLVCMHIFTMCVPSATEARRGSQILWKWNYR